MLPFQQRLLYDLCPASLWPHRIRSALRNTMCMINSKDHFTLCVLPYHDQTIHLEICVTVQSELWRRQGRQSLLYLAPESTRSAAAAPLVVFRRRRRRALRSRPVSTIHTFSEPRSLPVGCGSLRSLSSWPASDFRARHRVLFY